MSISSSSGFQITIPDLDDDDLGNTPIPFGRSGGAYGGFGRGGGGGGGGQDSPTGLMTPLAFGGGGSGGGGGGGFGTNMMNMSSTTLNDPSSSSLSSTTTTTTGRGFFSPPHSSSSHHTYSHTRGDSVASEDSSISQHAYSVAAKYTALSNIPSSGGGGGGGGFGTPSLSSKTSGGGSAFHSSQSSLPASSNASLITSTPTSTFTKKSSFASLRNAFKSSGSKNNSNNNHGFGSSRDHRGEDAPPVPPIDYFAYQGQPYPALKNPFNRSTSSLGQARGGGTPALNSLLNNPNAGGGGMGPPPMVSPRPQTPTTSRPSPRRAHSSHAKPPGGQHSQSGSIFHTSDAGSDGGGVGGGHGGGHHTYSGSNGSAFNFGYPPNASSSPPPVPRMPRGLHNNNAYNGSATQFNQQIQYNGFHGRNPTTDEGDLIVMDPKTPSGFALHAVFMRFVTAAEEGINEFLKHPIDSEPLLPTYLGPGCIPSLDETIHSLAKIASSRSAPPVPAPPPLSLASSAAGSSSTSGPAAAGSSAQANSNAKAVIESIMRWRGTSQYENVGAEMVHWHVNRPLHSTDSYSGGGAGPGSLPGPGGGGERGGKPHDIPALLNERKSLASIYLMCRTLIIIVQALSSSSPSSSSSSSSSAGFGLGIGIGNAGGGGGAGGGALGDGTGNELEKSTFEQFRKPNLKLLLQSRNHRVNAELYASLLGVIAGVRFVSVTDRFLAELGPVANGQVQKDADMRYENLVKGIRHIKIKVWPTEAFDEGAEFLEALSKSFANAHGLRFKIAFAETLVHILHPIGKTAQVETNDPIWRKAIELIYPKAKEMASKPRYWHAAFPLVITSLCVGPQDFFLKNWGACFEMALGKIKEKGCRVIVLNGILRLIWTYLYRCQESGSTTTSKLEQLFKHFFPTNRLTVFPSPSTSLLPSSTSTSSSSTLQQNEDQQIIQALVYIVHFALSRHPEFGRELCMELMQESTIAAANSASGAGVASGGGGGAAVAGGNNPQGENHLAPERTAVAIQAILLSLHVMEREEIRPTWPSSIDFTALPANEDYPTSAEFMPAPLMAKPSVSQFFERCGGTLAGVAVSAANAVGKMSVLDEQWVFTRIGPSYEESHNYVVRRHDVEGGTGSGATTVAYPSHLLPQMSLLQTCFQSWPRCLHPSFPVSDAVDLLVRCVVHVEPLLASAAIEALKRFMRDYGHAMIVLGRYTVFLFSPARVAHESVGVRLLVECSKLLELWVWLVEEWVKGSSEKIKAGEDKASGEQQQDVAAIRQRANEIEAGALFLLSHQMLSVRKAGTKVVKALGLLSPLICPDLTETPPLDLDPPPPTLRFVELLHGKGMQWDWMDTHSDTTSLLESKDLIDRLDQLRALQNPHLLLQISESGMELDRVLWRHLYPKFMQMQMDVPAMAQTLASVRETMIAAATKYLPLIAHLAGLSTRAPAGFQTMGSSSRAQHLALVGVNTPAGLASSSAGGAAASASVMEGNRVLAENGHFISQWYAWTKVLSSTAIVQESRPAHAGREHQRAPSDANFEKERLSTTRGLFRYLTPFLDSEYLVFRDAAVLCVCSFPVASYPALLEDLSLLAGRQFYDDPRSKGTRRHERLHSTVARIYYLTAPLLEQQRAMNRQTSLSNVLKFVRNTQTFLTSPEIREKHQWQLLRRYFCGTVERLFDSLASLKDTDHFISPNMHLTLYRLCEEWCQLGPQQEGARARLVTMQRAANAAPNDFGGDPIERFQQETLALSDAAVGALSSLCQKAFVPPDSNSGSPSDRLSPERIKALTASSVLERLSAILSSIKPHLQVKGKKALRFLLTTNVEDKVLLNDSLRRSAVTSDHTDTSSCRFFEVIADIICSGERHGFTFSQTVWLGLVNLCHPAESIRQPAFDILECMHHQSAGILSMTQFEASILSSAPSSYGHAHRLISDFLAGEHPHEGMNFLAQLDMCLPHIPGTSSMHRQILLLLLQSLECWVPNVELLDEDPTLGISSEGVSALCHLMGLTMRYSQNYAEQVMALWTKLVEPPHQSNALATVRFLLEQSHKVGNASYIDCAANIVACLCQTGIGSTVYEELCSVIEPVRMLPSLDHKLAFPDADDMEIWSDLDALFAEQPRIPSLGAAQFAWLFLAEVTIQRPWEFRAQLPVLLHALFSHIDHRVLYLRQQAQKMLFQLLRSWVPGYDDLSDRSNHPNRITLKRAIADLEKDAQTKFWKEDELSVTCEPKMRWLCKQVLSLLDPLCPRLAERWGSLALLWGTSCSIRAIAFRSLQIFRSLTSRATKSDLALLLGRLSNTIADPDPNIQRFTSEILLTLNSLVSRGDIDRSQLPQFFWCACACLCTPVEEEFKQTLALLEPLLDRIGLDDPITVELLLTNRPRDWSGRDCLQPLLIKGLRSSTTCGTTLKTLQILAAIEDDRLIDPTSGRVRDMYTVALPWCARAMSSDSSDPNLQIFAENIARLAKKEGRDSIAKIMTSFSKNAFRTKDDFIRQSMASLREHYGTDSWTEIATLLLGLVLNNERWLRVQVMQMIKVLFQQRAARNPTELLGSEHLMPLLRLLDTDLATQALDVLEEPLTISGGPAAKHVLRMSMHAASSPMMRNTVAVADVFGAPQESGWCVPNPSALLDTCRNNVMAVFDTCSVPSRPSQIQFEPEVEVLSESFSLHHHHHHHHHTPQNHDDLGGLVQNLHELTTFFQHSQSGKDYSPTTPAPLSVRMEARVAAILAKSTNDSTVSEYPRTPFGDVFQVDGMDDSDEETDDDSDSGSDSDAFLYDSPTFFRSNGIPNGTKYH